MSDASAAPKSTSEWEPVAPAPAVKKERGFVADLLVFAWENKWWWIVPTVLILGGLGVLIGFAGSQRFVPFFYALF
jgi:hypothetical protein